MNDQDPKNMNIEFRKVYLSDLNVLIRIYNNKTKQAASPQLTAHFGLPLTVAINNNVIIGFACASTNDLEELTLSSHCVNDDVAIGNTLKAEAEKTLHATFSGIREDRTSLKHAIQHLLSWLNTCTV
ncbi:hypothetical protein OQX61_14920 [Pedobacter sp. PLR]|uniref:hypothetical protein n=1 Tax=Pedobacter sp. PLR TaxID=2994465 RepID=UPI00224757D0|nr:hypothetical protein [Pedobacter sp. PLR]MCX2452567.1 hypothetical protein [Pedobacter sp. PLR]